MCVNQKCMPVAQLRAAGSSCPNNCSGNGICNSLGHCHCDAGFAPPLCEYPGFGGSEDSGPTTDPNGKVHQSLLYQFYFIIFAEGKEFVTAMFIIFLGIIPALAIFGLILYYTRHNLKITWPQTTRKYVLNFLVHVFCACKGVGKKSKQPIPTISQQVSTKNGGSERNPKLEIKQTGLISTTNTDVINRNSRFFNVNESGSFKEPLKSGLAENKSYRLSLKNVKNLKFKNMGEPEYVNIGRTPADTEAVGSTDENIKYITDTDVKNINSQYFNVDLNKPPKGQPKSSLTENKSSRLSFKNVKALKLNTNIKVKNKVAPQDINAEKTPATAETVCSLDETPTTSVQSLAKKFSYLSSNPNNS